MFLAILFLCFNILFLLFLLFRTEIFKLHKFLMHALIEPLQILKNHKH